MLGPAPPPPQGRNSVTMDTVLLKKSVKSCIRHANDSKAFLKLLQRTQQGSALKKILEFSKTIDADLASYTILLDEISGKIERKKTEGVEDLGSSIGEDYEFFVNINKGKLSDNPLL